MKRARIGAPLATMLAVWSTAHAYDVNENFAVGGVIAGAGQCQSSSDSEASDTCLDAVPFQLELSYRPNEANELFAKIGSASGNGLNQVSPWISAPWAADLEDDVKDINGRNRDYLLVAWYKHNFSLGKERTLGATFGILDSTDYLDGNEYANDEFTQFMNEVFVNSRIYGLPSYDRGVALEYGSGAWTVSGLGMNIGENDDGNNYNFWGTEIAYQVENGLGVGNYRLTLTETSSAFLDPTASSKESRRALGLSFDQEFTDSLGVFVRFAWQNDNAAVDYKALYSGGINITGGSWGRSSDNIGIAYAYLDGGNLEVEFSQLFETYYRFELNEFFALTADAQYLKDENGVEESPKGWVIGLRAVVEF